MQQIINKPLASTFGWLHMNGTLLEVPEEKEQQSLVIHVPVPIAQRCHILMSLSILSFHGRRQTTDTS